MLLTPGPAEIGLVARVAKANSLSADLLISIHHDSVPEWLLEIWEHSGQQKGFSDRFQGYSIFVSKENIDPAASLSFARILGTELQRSGLRYTPHYTEEMMGPRRRKLVDSGAGVYQYDQLWVLKETDMPAVLLEAGSIVNRGEELLLASPEHQVRIASAVKNAIESFCSSRASPK